MAVTRSLSEIEKDIANIDHALSTVSEIRSSLKHFKTLVQDEQKGPSFVQSFGDKLKHIRRDLGILSADSEILKAALEHAQIAAKENKFDWDLIKSEAEREAEEEEMRYQEEKADTGKAKEVGSTVKSNADHLYKELASIVLERKATTAEMEDKFFTKRINEWMNTNKINYMDFAIGFLKEEQATLSGSICRVKKSKGREKLPARVTAPRFSEIEFTGD
ncbi:hypothetical protein BDF20DRAFT_557765 [Mycotypha africana]|uniref:uncharacterized protein n=1 Tax=Mycotypha africana TaxID=64632 RepID=UPI002300B20B|nr:uncharacterized protein BDF20DRAFT_557765 [Mycotypha africana]KAI8977294.1 hypothetical protein BDF20DRAFT_557765 [Mycotypha africana]